MSQEAERRATETVANDDGIIGSTATTIARAMSLEGNNRTLGRKFVRMALDSPNVDSFVERSKDYAAMKREILSELYHSIIQKRNNVLLQIELDDSDFGELSYGDGQKFLGFSAKVERLDSNAYTGTEGGLMKHTFQPPVNRPRASVLGLDK